MNKYNQSNSNTYLICSNGNNLEKVHCCYLIIDTLPRWRICNMQYATIWFTKVFVQKRLKNGHKITIQTLKNNELWMNSCRIKNNVTDNPHYPVF